MARFIPPQTVNDNYCGLVLTILELAVLKKILCRVGGHVDGLRGVSQGISDAVGEHMYGSKTFLFMNKFLSCDSLKENSITFIDAITPLEKEMIIQECLKCMIFRGTGENWDGQIYTARSGR